MATRYPMVVFAPDGGATFVVRMSLSDVSQSLTTPMPAVSADGHLAPPWRWGGHQVDLASRVVHFRFVNRSDNSHWTCNVPFEWHGDPSAE